MNDREMMDLFHMNNNTFNRLRTEVHVDKTTGRQEELIILCLQLLVGVELMELPLQGQAGDLQHDYHLAVDATKQPR